MHFSIDRTVHTTAFDKPVVDHWMERKIAQTAAGSTEKDRSDDRPLQIFKLLLINRNKNNVCEVLYLLHTFCFYENDNFFYYISFFF